MKCLSVIIATQKLAFYDEMSAFIYEKLFLSQLRNVVHQTPKSNVNRTK